MQNFISTETIMLISMLSKKMPNLLKYINEYANPKSAKNMAPNPTTTLSPKQILEARHHPNGIILQTLGAILVIQNALNFANSKIEDLIKQRTKLENTLVTLLAINKGKGSK